jgi:hypothetical protein
MDLKRFYTTEQLSEHMYETPEGNYCQCGCGTEIAENRRFVNHHHAKDCICSICKAKRGELLGDKNPMFGTHRTGVDNPFYGKKHSQETKIRMRHPKKDSSNMGKYERTEEVKKKYSETMIQLWSDSENRKRLMKIKRSIEYREKLKGENNPNWRGGLSKFPYTQDWTEDLRDSIRKRDNYSCKLCNISQEETGRKLDVHHIDYDKENCDPNNLISLCICCHTKTTSGNREMWKAYFYRRNCRERRA